MSTPEAQSEDSWTDQTGAVPTPPRTGNGTVDQALRELQDLDRRPLAEHHAALAAAQEALGRALEESRQSPTHTIAQQMRSHG
ncbi:hypothetical protein GCM10027030_20980 [Luteococcus sediminum]